MLVHASSVASSQAKLTWFARPACEQAWRTKSITWGRASRLLLTTNSSSAGGGVSLPASNSFHLGVEYLEEGQQAGQLEHVADARRHGGQIDVAAVEAAHGLWQEAKKKEADANE